MGQAGVLGDRQRIHVGAQPNAALRRPPPQRRDDAMPADAGLEGNAELGELVLHKGGGSLLLEGELGMRMQMPAPRGQFLVQLGCQGGVSRAGSHHHSGIFASCIQQQRMPRVQQSGATWISIRVECYREEGPFPLPLAGEGWGEGVSTSGFYPDEERALTRRAGRCCASPDARRPLPQAGEVRRRLRATPPPSPAPSSRSRFRGRAAPGRVPCRRRAPADARCRCRARSRGPPDKSGSGWPRANAR
ncbi:hypothetical protein ACVWXO_010590 [Bradyrhizobium sp. LM2.7]